MSKLRLKKTLSQTRSVSPVEEVSERNKLFSCSNDEDILVSNDDCSEIVVSKHFKKSENIDNSLSDFVEVKKTVHPPVKNVEDKPKRTRNVRKKQADIRKVMKKKKSSLIEESQQFEEVCRKGGIDVNPEHLQLAIALSRSISDQKINSDSVEETSVETLSSYECENVKKVRKTLEQFGFKVKSDPIRLNSDRSNVKKKFLKSKLLNFCPQKRRQLIDEKLSMILNESIDNVCIPEQNATVLTSDILKEIFSECKLWFGETRDENYYVLELVQPGTKKLGRLLKNWDDIPGRPKSPKRKIVKEVIMNSENCDIFLGSTFENLQKIIYPKSAEIECSSSDKNFHIDDELPDVSKAFDNPGNCSPDLIEIEDYSNEEINIPHNENLKENSSGNEHDCLIFEQSYCSDVVESQNGILLYESFHDDNKCLKMAEKTKNFDKSVCEDDDNDCTIIEDEIDKSNSQKRFSDLRDMTEKPDYYNLSVHEDECTIVEDEINNEDLKIDSSNCSIDLIEDNFIHENISNNLTNEKSISENASETSWKNKSAFFSENNKTPNLSYDEIILSDDEINYSMSRKDENVTKNPSSLMVFSPNNEIIEENIMEKSSMSMDFSLQKSYYEMNDEIILSDEEKVMTNPSSSMIFSPQQSNYEIPNLTRSNDEIILSDDEINDKNIIKKTSKSMNSSPQQLKNKFFKPNDQVIKEKKHLSSIVSSPHPSVSSIPFDSTPENNKFVIKTENVTPLPDFNAMSLPEIESELNRFGLRALKRKRAIQLLEHIYDQTHPKLDNIVGKCKQRKLDYSDPKDEIKTLKKKTKSFTDVPINLAFKDFLTKRMHVKEEILNYNPLSLERLHKDLKSEGYKYNIKDLIKFLDEKCITFRTEKNNLKS